MYVATSGIVLVPVPVPDGSAHALHVPLPLTLLVTLALVLVLVLAELTELVDVASGTLDHAVESPDPNAEPEPEPDAFLDLLETYDEDDEENVEDEDAPTPSVHADHDAVPVPVCVDLADMSAGVSLDVVPCFVFDEDEDEAGPVLMEVLELKASVVHAVHESKPDIDGDSEPVELVVFELSPGILLVPSAAHVDHCTCSVDLPVLVAVAVAARGIVTVTVEGILQAEHHICVVVYPCGTPVGLPSHPLGQVVVTVTVLVVRPVSQTLSMGMTYVVTVGTATIEV